MRGKKNCSITSVLNELHWLKIEERIVFKVLLLVFKCLNGLCSDNLETLLRKLPNQCRSQNMSLLETRWANTKYGKRTFSYAGPKLWNMLTASIQSLKDVERFKKDRQYCLKTLNKYTDRFYHSDIIGDSACVQ